MFLHLVAPQAVIEERVGQRSARDEHFAGVELLAAQYALLEPLGLDEVGGLIDVSHLSVRQVVLEAADIVSREDD